MSVMSWERLNPIEYRGVSGHNGQQAFRQPENRGLAFEVDVIVTFTVVDCATADPQNAMTPEPYATIRALARVRSLWVRFPNGATRTMTLQASSLPITLPYGAYTAKLRFTDALPTWTSEPDFGGYTIPVLT